MKIEIDLPFVWCPECNFLSVEETKIYTDESIFFTERSCKNEKLCTHLEKEINKHGRNKTL